MVLSLIHNKKAASAARESFFLVRTGRYLKPSDGSPATGSGQASHVCLAVLFATDSGSDRFRVPSATGGGTASDRFKPAARTQQGGTLHLPLVPSQNPASSRTSFCHVDSLSVTSSMSAITINGHIFVCQQKKQHVRVLYKKTVDFLI